MALPANRRLGLSREADARRGHAPVVAEADGVVDKLDADSRARPGARSLFDTLRLWRRRARERAELSRFRERELYDIGISTVEAQREIGKPPWRA